jgi:hypothetical protein
MSKDQARLQHLLVRMQARYGEHDADVLQLRDAVQRLELNETRVRATLRYSEAPLFSDRAARLAHASLVNDYPNARLFLDATRLQLNGPSQPSSTLTC